MRRAALAGLVFFSTAGCAPAAFFAAPDDYAAYRATRVGATFEARLAAADDYLARFPAGTFRGPVEAYFRRAEPVYFGAKRGSVRGLEAYLRALRHGPHRAEAEGRLSALAEARRNQRAALGEVVRLGEALDRAAAERRRARATVTTWLSRFLDADLWRAPLVEAKASFIVPWSLSLPSPLCARLDEAGASERPRGAARRCVKLLELPYAVAADGASEARQITAELTLLEDAAGRPLQATLAGPEFFLRLEETLTARASLPPGAEEARESTALETSSPRALALVADTFGEAVSSDSACRRPASPPAALALECHGARLVARAAALRGEDDVIEVTPSSSAR